MVGAGLSGLTIAERCASLGHEVLVIEKRDHIGGNCFDFRTPSGQMVSRYGPHTFHTNDEEVWQYVNRFGTWRPFEYQALSNVDGKLVPVPVNIITVNEVFGLELRTEDEMATWLRNNTTVVESPKNSEEAAVSRIGRVLYEKMFKLYTKKQWDIWPVDLDASVLTRIPIRTNFDNRYFTDKYQALPVEGYASICQNLIDEARIQVLLNCDWNVYKDRARQFSKIFFTGPIDSYFEGRFGDLQYRSVRFHFEQVEGKTAQRAPAVHYPQNEEYTRTVDYKYFYPNDLEHTIVAKEYPTWEGEPYYPVPNSRNHDIYERYRVLAIEAESEGLFFVGRLANYKYFNMDQAIRNALDLFYRLES